MASSTPIISFAVAILVINYIPSSTSYLASQYQYPPQSLACKTFEIILDCSNRNLFDVPVLDEIFIITLDLSHNYLTNITTAPFEKLQDLLRLDLSNNAIYLLSSTSFRGLQSLEYLDLQGNKLTNIPKDVFSNLLQLVDLNLNQNDIEATPGQALASLRSLKHLTFPTGTVFSEKDMEGFQHLTNLNQLLFCPTFKKINVSHVFDQFADLPLKHLAFCWWSDDNISVDKEVFAPLKSITNLYTILTALPAMTSLNSPLQYLKFGPNSIGPKKLIMNETSLKVLQKWNTSLNHLKMHNGNLIRVENNTFAWIPNLLNLNLSLNEINYLAKDAFYGLISLQILDLFSNLLTEIPSEVFTNTFSLRYLEIRANPIATHIAQDAFSAVSNSLTHLNLKYSSNIVSEIRGTKWLDFLPNLQHLSLTTGSPTSGQPRFLPVTSQIAHQSFYTLQISNFFSLYLNASLCEMFSKLIIVKLTDIKSEIIGYPSSLALEKCCCLRELDISGSLHNINFDQLVHLKITIQNLDTLKMARNKLSSVRQVFFLNAPNITSINVAENEIVSIDNGIATAYPRLVSLNVRNNALTSLSGLEHLSFLETLLAAGNQFTSVQQWLVSSSRRINLRILDLSNNPYHCVCSLEPFRKWIVSDNKTWLIPGQYLCSTPESLEGMSITAIELDCKPKTPFYLSIIIPCALLFCLTIFLLIRYKWHIKYKLFLLYRHYRPFPNIQEDFEMLELQYHAYVSYNENSATDDAWVMDDLQPNMEEGSEPLRLCIKSRDFMPGRAIIENINNCMHQSRKTLLVLSPGFVESEWCYHEMQMAQMRLFDDNLDVLSLVLLKDIPERKMTMSLRQLLTKKEYFKWPNDRARQRLFWQRLGEEIKGPVHVDRCFQL